MILCILPTINRTEKYTDEGFGSLKKKIKTGVFVVINAFAEWELIVTFE